MTSPELAIVIVNWNVRELVRRCLGSLRVALDTAGLAATVVVVDNGSTDDSVTLLRAEFPWVQVIASPTNLGFTAGNNLGLRVLGFRPGEPPTEVGAGGTRATGPPAWTPGTDASAATDDQPAAPQARFQPPPPYVLLLNPDTEVVGDALPTMLAYMDTHPDVGLLGPRLRYPDGNIQSSRRRFPTVTTGLLESTMFQAWWPDHATLRRFYMADQPEDHIQDVDWLVGACLLTRREALSEVGLLDEGFFMYSEEVDWAKRFKQAGWRVVYLPTAEIMHYEGRSSSQVVPLRHIHFQTSKARYFRKWHGPLVGEGIRLFLLLTYVIQIVAEGAKWLLGHKRSLRAERIAAYGRVLRTGLRRSGS